MSQQSYVIKCVFVIKMAHKHYKRLNLLMKILSTGSLIKSTVSGLITLNVAVIVGVSSFLILFKSHSEVKNYS